jgi:PAS domain S-box-containing protein
MFSDRGGILMTKKPTYDELEQRVKALEKQVAQFSEIEEAFRDSEERFRQIVQNSQAGYFFVDLNGQWKDVNAAWLKMHGYSSREEVIGKHFSLTQVDGDMKAAQKNVERLLSGEPIPAGEFSRRRKDGSIAYHTFSAGPVMKGGEIIGLEGFIIDDTERKLAQEAFKQAHAELRAAFNTIPGKVNVVDMDYNILDVSDRFADAVSKRERKNIVGSKCYKIYKKRDSICPECAVQRVFESGRLETRVTTPEEEKITGSSCKIYASPMKDEQGNITGAVECAMDITDLKRVEEALMEKKAELKTKAKNLEEMNTALRVLLKGRQEDKEELEEKVMSNVRDLVLPYLKKLKKTSLDTNQIACISVMESNLNDIISPFARRLSSKYLGLTPTEIRVANFVKDGMTTKEIAEFMNLSCRTVETYRDNIRRKMRIKHKKTNLRTYLSSLH